MGRGEVFRSGSDLESYRRAGICVAEGPYGCEAGPVVGEDRARAEQCDGQGADVGAASKACRLPRRAESWLGRAAG